MTPAIAILGAGPSGLTLARLLEKQNIDYVVFERNESEESSIAGGSLDLHPGSGQLALKEGGVFEEFKKYARYDATTLKIFDQNGNLHVEYDAERDAPEIDRWALRKILLHSLPKERVRWNHTVKSVGKRADGEVVVVFADGSTASGFKLVVGADGSGSKVRPLLTSAKPSYSGFHTLETDIPPGSSFSSTLSATAGLGTMMALGSDKSINAMRSGDGSYKVRIGRALPEDWARSGVVDLSDGDAARKMFLEKKEFFAGWAPELQDFIRHSEGGFRAWPLYYMPIEALSWESVPGVTLIGDAAHVTTPFVGEGANCSMHDSLTLARKIAEHGVENLPQAVSEYEKLMFERAIDLITRSQKSEKLLFTEDAPKTFLEALKAGQVPIGERDNV